MIGLTHPAINQRGGNDRAEVSVLRDIFNLYLPCFDCLVISLLNPTTTPHCYTDPQLGAQPQPLTITIHKTHSCVYVRAQGQISPNKRTVTPRNINISPLLSS